MSAALSEFPQLAPYLEMLYAMGLRSIAEFYAVAEGNPEALADFLMVDLGNVLRSLPPPPVVPPELRSSIAKADFSLGVPLDVWPYPKNAFAAIVPALGAPLPSWPQNVNLIPTMPAVRDQGKRETCVAFVTTAMMEQQLKCEIDFSEQFLYWNCKQNDGVAQRGTFLSVAFPITARDGCCLETTWAYSPALTSGLDDHDPPPAGARSQALKHKIKGSNRLAATSINDIKAELVAGKAVALTIPVFPSWRHSIQTAASGDITNPVPNESRMGGHAVCIVGFEEHPQAVGWGGGRFLYRNSWGTAWGAQCSYGAGNGTIPYSYVARYGVEAFSLI